MFEDDLVLEYAIPMVYHSLDDIKLFIQEVSAKVGHFYFLVRSPLHTHLFTWNRNPTDLESSTIRRAENLEHRAKKLESDVI